MLKDNSLPALSVVSVSAPVYRHYGQAGQDNRGCHLRFTGNCLFNFPLISGYSTIINRYKYLQLRPIRAF